MTGAPVVESVGTALPEHRLPQDRLVQLARSVLPEDAPDRERMLGVVESTGIRERSLALPVPWYLEPHGHAERNRAFVEVGLELVERATLQALDRAGHRPGDVGAVVQVSTTGLATPSLEARLANRIDLPPDVRRVPVWGLGCAGGVAGLNRACELARPDPGRPVVLVCLELCSLQFQLDRLLPDEQRAGLDKKATIAAMLFGDGCAAAVVTADGTRKGPRHVAGTSHLFPDTEGLMGWDVEDDVLDVVLSPRIPAFAARALGPVVHRFLDEQLGPGRRPDHWVLHPGGTKVMEGYAKALGLGDDELALARQTLADHGNMSSPTVLFALERALARGAPGPGETALLAALGPGFAAELCLLEGS